MVPIDLGSRDGSYGGYGSSRLTTPSVETAWPPYLLCKGDGVTYPELAAHSATHATEAWRRTVRHPLRTPSVVRRLSAGPESPPSVISQQRLRRLRRLRLGSRHRHGIHGSRQ